MFPSCLAGASWGYLDVSFSDFLRFRFVCPPLPPQAPALCFFHWRRVPVWRAPAWRSGPASKWDPAQTLAQTGSCQGVRPVAAALPGTPSFRVNSAAPSAPSPPAAGNASHPVTRNAASCCLISLCCQVNQSCFHRSSPAETRESQAAEGERLGKRVRKKRKIYMDSGDEEEENQEEPEVRGAIISLIMAGGARQGCG